MKTETYQNKELAYFTNPRLDLISLLPENPQQKVLEIGMGGGDTLVHIKQHRLASEVVGIDLVELPNTNQQNALINQVHYIDLDKEELPYDAGYFDVVIAGDVLEHLIDPWEAVKKLTSVVKVNGCLLISLPNIRDMYALYSLFFKGSFAYTNRGIFDKTHMRFFCKKDMIALIESEKNLKIEVIMPIQNFGDKNFKRKLFNKFTLSMLEEFTTAQYLFKVIKTAY